MRAMKRALASTKTSPPRTPGTRRNGEQGKEGKEGKNKGERSEDKKERPVSFGPYRDRLPVDLQGHAATQKNVTEKDKKTKRPPKKSPDPRLPTKHGPLCVEDSTARSAVIVKGRVFSSLFSSSSGPFLSLLFSPQFITCVAQHAASMLFASSASVQTAPTKSFVASASTVSSRSTKETKECNCYFVQSRQPLKQSPCPKHDIRPICLRVI